MSIMLHEIFSILKLIEIDFISYSRGKEKLIRPKAAATFDLYRLGSMKG